MMTIIYNVAAFVMDNLWIVSWPAAVVYLALLAGFAYAHACDNME